MHYTAPRDITSLAVGNLDNDDALEIVITLGKKLLGSPEALVLHASLTGTLSASSTLTLGALANLIQLRDINKDGHLDLIAISASSKDVRLYLGDGSGNFGPSQAPIALPSTPGGQQVLVVDFDEDGDLDLVLDIDSTATSKPLMLVRSDGQGFVTAESLTNATYDASPLAQPYPRSSFRAPLPAVGDFDGDGDMDLVRFGIGGTTPSLLYEENITPPSPTLSVNYGASSELVPAATNALAEITLSAATGDVADVRLQSIALRSSRSFKHP